MTASIYKDFTGQFTAPPQIILHVILPRTNS